MVCQTVLWLWLNVPAIILKQRHWHCLLWRMDSVAHVIKSPSNYSRTRSLTLTCLWRIDSVAHVRTWCWQYHLCLFSFADRGGKPVNQGVVDSPTGDRERKTFRVINIFILNIQDCSPYYSYIFIFYYLSWEYQSILLDNEPIVITLKFNCESESYNYNNDLFFFKSMF